MLSVIQSLWIGDSLSNLEKLCIQSFMDNGHEFHLYVYENVAGIPDGTIIKDANEILHKDLIFRRRGKITTFSNWFRYALLAKMGGFGWIWIRYALNRLTFPMKLFLVWVKNSAYSIH